MIHFQKPQKIIFYARFSTGEQAKGSTLTRQFGNMKREASGYASILGDVPTEQMSDKGLSGYHGMHRLRGAFGTFERDALAGMHPNSLLVAENLDRLTREGDVIARRLLEDLTKAGVAIWLLDGGYFEPWRDPTAIQSITATLVAQRAREESATKSNRAGSAWVIRRDKAVEEGKAMSAKVCPPWLAVVDDAYSVVEWKVEYIRRMFELADAGEGASHIMGIMNRDHPKPLGWSNRARKDLKRYWDRTEINGILRNRQLIGERQDKTRHHDSEGTLKQELNGDAVAGMYPIAIDPALFERVQRNAAVRKKVRGGGKSKNVTSLVSGLVKCAECGSATIMNRGHIYCTTWKSKARHVCDMSVSLRYKGKSGEGFEKSLLDQVLALAMDDGAFARRDEVGRLATEHAKLTREVELAEAKAERAWDAVSTEADAGRDTTFPERAARKAVDRFNEVKGQLAQVHAALEAARGRVSDEEHLARVAAIRDQIEDREVRLKIAQSLHGLIGRITIDRQGATVFLKGEELEEDDPDALGRKGYIRFDRLGNYVVGFDWQKDGTPGDAAYEERRRKIRQERGRVFGIAA